MSKRDDLENEAKGELGLFGALALGLGALAIKSVSKNSKRNKLTEEIAEKRDEINDLNNQINEEQGKFFLTRDDSKISALKQKRSRLISEKKSLEAELKEL